MATARACLAALVVVLMLIDVESSAAPENAGGRKSVQQRRRQVQSLLRRLNKPPVKTIESLDGDIIDCVPISKQPAFDHPSLHNHTIQMEPSYHPWSQYQDSNVAPCPFTQTWLQNGTCPEKTIPIRRIREEDVLRASSISRFGKKSSRSMPFNGLLDGHQWAEAYATGDDSYYGTQATFNLWQPKVETAQDFSLSQLWLTSGSYGNKDLNTIEVGWQVYPQLYGDDTPRLFIYWTRDAYNKTGCYNLLCSGFVQTNTQIVIGGRITQLSPVSIYNGSQYDLRILAWKDPGTGNWWLRLGSSYLGYWPSSIFTNLANRASSVEWGGEVYAPPSAGITTTQMGSGHFPAEGYRKASYIKDIQVVDSNNYLKTPSGVGLIASLPNCYSVEKGASSSWGTYIFYGGPGKNANCKNSFTRDDEYPLLEAI
ncbi:hypothetical protein BS78_05G256400 [Paspalum vaginatum]|nr:hypothetical protein BS78_05G256400 [Paspalum vaginatum]